MRHNCINYDRDKNTIIFNGDILIDMSKVPAKAKATLYSGVVSDFQAYATDFQVNGSNSPFDLSIAALSPTGLIKAIVENRLEVEGMVVSKAIQEAYAFLWDNDSLQ